MKPKKVDAINSVFPTVTDGYLPPYSEIPDEFKRGRTEWNKVFSKWFYSGLPKGTNFIPKGGIDQDGALRHIKYCMGSWEPKHEHKEAGVAYLMSLWFERVEIPSAQPTTDSPAKCL